MMPIDQETEDRLKSEITRLEQEGFTPEQIKWRLEKAGFDQATINQLVKLPQTTRTPAIQEKPDLFELVDSLAIFLDSAMPKLFDYHHIGQYETLVGLKNFHTRLKEAVDAHRD